MCVRFILICSVSRTSNDNAHLSSSKLLLSALAPISVEESERIMKENTEVKRKEDGSSRILRCVRLRGERRRENRNNAMNEVNGTSKCGIV